MTGSVVPKTCRAAVVENPGPNYTIKIIDDYPVPKPGPGEVLIKMNATGLCLSDHHQMLGDLGLAMQEHVHCVGHEGAGKIVQIGEGVDPSVWKIGDRAGLKPIFDVCTACEFCRSGKETICPKAVMTGFHCDGSYQEYVLSPARYTTRIPDNVPDELAGPVMCSGATAYYALRNSEARAGQWLAVAGAGGGVGSMVVQYGRALGLKVIGIDGGASKRKLCMDLGAEAFVDFTEGPVRDQIMKITGDGCHVVIVTAGVKSSYQDAHLLLRRGGTIVGVGLPAADSGALLGGHPIPIIASQITVRGSLVCTLDATDEALQFVARGQVKPAIETFPFSKLPELVAKLAKGEITGRAVCLYD